MNEYRPNDSERLLDRLESQLDASLVPALALSLLALGLVLVLLLSGCSVPTTSIRLGNVVARFPKQTCASNLVLRVGTNGVLELRADWLKAENEPSVIEATGAADAARVNALTAGAGTIIGAAVSAARSRDNNPDGDILPHESGLPEKRRRK